MECDCLKRFWEPLMELPKYEDEDGEGKHEDAFI